MEVWMVLAIVLGSLIVLFYLTTGILIQREVGREACQGSLCRHQADKHGHGVFHLKDDWSTGMRIMFTFLWIVFLIDQLIEDGPDILRSYVLGDT